MKKFFVESLNGLENRIITAASCEVVEICGQKHYLLSLNGIEAKCILCKTVKAVYELVEVK